MLRLNGWLASLCEPLMQLLHYNLLAVPISISPFAPHSALSGYNSTIFAYGQTGSGKVSCSIRYISKECDSTFKI